MIHYVMPHPNLNARYVYRKEPISKAEARKIRAQEITIQREYISRLKKELAESEENLAVMRELPLQVDRIVQTTLYPGDPGYDEAPVRFDPIYYQGNIRWVNSNHQTP